MRLGSMAVMVVVCLVCLQCGPGEPGAVDSGVVAQVDAGVDSGVELATDAGPYRLGQVQMVQLTVDAGTTVLNVGVLSTIFTEIQTCRSQRSGACELLTCEGTTVSKSAGVLRLEGSSIDGGLTLDTGMSASVSRPELLWQRQDQILVVSSTGADVPAFTSTVGVPAKLELSPAVCSSVGCTRHGRATPLRREWTGGAPGTVVRVTLATATQRLRCDAQAESGVLTVPSIALEELPPGRAQLLWEVSRTAASTTGQWSLEVSATNHFEAGQVILE